jgi:hypothetical protein
MRVILHEGDEEGDGGGGGGDGAPQDFGTSAAANTSVVNTEGPGVKTFIAVLG